MISRLFTAVLLLTLSQGSVAQFLNTVKYEKEALSLYSGVVGMHEDFQGYKWIYGSDGISRYDGFQFEEIESIFPSAENLISKNCKSLFRDEKFLWIGSASNGLSLLDHNGTIFLFNDLLTQEDSLNSRIIKQILTIDNRLFIIGENGLEGWKFFKGRWVRDSIGFSALKSITRLKKYEDLLFAISPDGLQRIDLKTKQHSSFPEYKSASLFLDTEGKLWMAEIGRGTTLRMYDEESGKYIASEYQPYSQYKQNRRWSWLAENQLLSFPKNNVMLQIADFENNTITHVDEVLSGLQAERFLRDPFLDSDNRTWLIGQHLFMIPQKTAISTEFVSLNEGEVRDVLITNSKIYSSIANKGLFIFDKRTQKTINLNVQNSNLADNFISNISPLRSGGIALCMMNFFQTFHENTGFTEPFSMPGITRSCYESDKHYWIGGFKNLFKIDKYDRKVLELPIPVQNRKEGNAINSILNLGNNNVGIYTASNGVRLLNTDGDSTEHIEELITLSSFKTSTYKVNHADISPDKKLIAIATDDGIYVKKNPVAGEKSDQLNRMVQMMKYIAEDDEESTKLPLNERFFTNVIFHSDSVLYASSRTHILRITIGSDHVETFSVQDGIINSNFTLRSCYKDTEGLIYFGGDRGIDRIDEDRFINSHISSKPILAQVLYNGKPEYGVQTKQKLVVPSDIKILEAKVNLPRNLKGNLTRIQAKLSSDDDWFHLGDDRTLSMYNPKAGSMQLEFRAVNPYSRPTSETLKTAVRINRIWYLNPWIWSLSTVLLILGATRGISLYQQRKNARINEDLRLQEELATLKLTSLNSQLNPHFIFNALSSIQQLITSGDSETAEKYLSKFSKLLRHVIQYASHQNVSVLEEIDFIVNYLELELLRFADAFTYTIENKIENAENVYIPPFFVQPQVENAIKHGFRKKKKNNKIHILFEMLNDSINIVIKDNGMGRKAAAQENIYASYNTEKGNLLTEDRIENLNKLRHESSFTIEDMPVGTSVSLSFSNKNNKDHE